ncbi:hypothetical protein JI752_007760 [Lysobacter sp. MMG2]|uniref:hypothetical protein n=1 Tax=Lysobacter sp. MMG2 TaxID=2801338 RepID=UPI001C2470FD|nr:hypothetical protein [Lysobacter sp. MMG2]MBU8976039.1 hypothetical protein [Lysobacter sp. MMG2]
MPTWPELQSQLQALRDDVPSMLRETPDTATFFDTFAGKADFILKRAPPDMVESVHTELGAILRDMKLADDGED